MTEYEKTLVFLAKCELSNKKMQAVMEFFEDYEIETLSKLLDRSELSEILSQNEFHSLLRNYDERELASFISGLESDGVKVVTKEHDDYPMAMFSLDDAPMILFAKGDTALLNQSAIAIVGTRVPSNYGQAVTEKFAKGLAESGFVVVSGLAMGVDCISHKGALAVGGKTIAVLGGGFERIYPEMNTNLAKQIANEGLLVAEYIPSARPTKYTFPRRNRIIAGLSKGTLITEAGIKSGTLHTKEFALEYGRDLFAVPGNINSAKSELPNKLIRDGQAICVLDENDILKHYDMGEKEKIKKTVQLSFEEEKIVKLLENGEQSLDDLEKNLDFSVNILNSCLTTLEIRGLIKRTPTRTYMLNF